MQDCFYQLEFVSYSGTGNEMKTVFSILFIVTYLFLVSSCSTKYAEVEVNRFTRAAESISKNTLNVYELASDEEVASLVSRAIVEDRITPAAFQRKVVTEKSYKLRKKLVKVLNKYAEALRVLLCEEGKGGSECIESFNNSLKSVSARHGNFISEKKRGLIKSLLSDILMSSTVRKKRRAAVKAMREVQPVLIKLSGRMSRELKALNMLTDNFLAFTFKKRVADMWPSDREKRVKYAELGADIVRRKNEMKELFRCAVKSIEAIPLSHLRLIERLMDGKASVKEINRLLDKAIEFEENYLKVVQGG